MLDTLNCENLLRYGKQLTTPPRMKLAIPVKIHLKNKLISKRDRRSHEVLSFDECKSTIFQVHVCPMMFEKYKKIILRSYMDFLWSDVNPIMQSISII